ncbi:MAG: hypothetical protein A2143_09225 [Gallionellales bacterium RBG_16_57_15]|nr:MAG: hypothetical protein A2143_09225 [Gallionellales bacterium RBG_16_57_15]
MPQSASENHHAMIAAKEVEIKKLPQVECPVIHRFGPGIYIRELSMPAGTFAIGHHQKFEHLNILLKGSVTMLNDDGTTTHLAAPLIYVSPPGKKVGYVHEDMVWQNIYATNETDADKLEHYLIDKTVADSTSDTLRLEFIATHDYKNMLVELDISEDLARTQSENESDQIPFPYGSYKVKTSPSSIEGIGLFATAPIEAGEIIAPARIGGNRTPAGRYTNHSPLPNAMMVALPNGDINLVAAKNIGGSFGGNVGEEITVNYRQAREVALLAAVPEKEVVCHQ